MSDETALTAPEPTFEDFRNENGICFWWASDLMGMLGYSSMQSFKKAIERGIRACMTLNIPHYENFIPEVRPGSPSGPQDYKLTRFACYLTVMNADPKKERVAAAQVYFAEQTRRYELSLQGSNEMDRLLIRDEMKEGNKSLMSVAKTAGVTDYARFANAGYRGQYNMLNVSLAKRRNIDKDKLADYMGRTELAANLFRITQTEERIKTFGVKGQSKLEETHYNVGREVREIVINNTGKAPEDLPVENRLGSVQNELRSSYRKMLKEDGGRKPKPTAKS